jgi:DNA-binding NarL/FixJ family response regulator
MNGDGVVRIVVAEGRPLYRRGLAALLRGHPGWSVVAEEDSGTGAIASTVRVHPDLVVLDLELPRSEGIETTRQIVGAAPGVGVLVMTRFADDRAVFEALCAGARGHLDKGAVHGEIVAAVSAVANGDAVLGPGVARLLVDFFGGRPAEGAADCEPLTGREHEIVNLVAAGWSTGDIAKVLVLTAPVVRAHITAAVVKLQAAHRPEPTGLWDAADGEVTPAVVEPPRRAAPRRRGTRRGRRR